jgi:hypothetical protein
MKRFTSALVLTIAFAAPASAFSVDMSLPTLTFPEPTETTQGCIQPAQIGMPGCAAGQ